MPGQEEIRRVPVPGIGLLPPHAQPWTGTAGRGEKRRDCGIGSCNDGGCGSLVLLDLGDGLLREDVLAGPDATLQEHGQEPGIVLCRRTCATGHIWIPVETHQVEGRTRHTQRFSDMDTEKLLPGHPADDLADTGSDLDGNGPVAHGSTGQRGQGSGGNASDTFLQRQLPVVDRGVSCRQSGFMGPKLSYRDAGLLAGELGQVLGDGVAQRSVPWSTSVIIAAAASQREAEPMSTTVPGPNLV